jgi:hypothetical protein
VNNFGRPIRMDRIGKKAGQPDGGMVEKTFRTGYTGFGKGREGHPSRRRTISSCKSCKSCHPVNPVHPVFPILFSVV